MIINEGTWVFPVVCVWQELHPMQVMEGPVFVLAATRAQVEKGYTMAS